MVRADQTELAPADVVDPLLWRDAQQMLGRHTWPDPDGACVWCGCRWPCAPRRLAERAAAASRRPWRVAWTLRHDLNSIRTMPGLDDTRARRRRPNQRPRTPARGNRGAFA